MTDFAPFYKALCALHKERRRISEVQFNAMWDVGIDLIDAMQKENLSEAGENAVKDALIKMKEILE